MRRYENRSTSMTSNRLLEEWGNLLNDVPTAGAILEFLESLLAPCPGLPEGRSFASSGTEVSHAKGE